MINVINEAKRKAAKWGRKWEWAKLFANQFEYCFYTTRVNDADTLKRIWSGISFIFVWHEKDKRSKFECLWGLVWSTALSKPKQSALCEPSQWIMQILLCWPFTSKPEPHRGQTHMENGLKQLTALSHFATYQFHHLHHITSRAHCQYKALEMNACWVVSPSSMLDVFVARPKGFPMSTASVIYAEIDIGMCMIMSFKFVWLFLRLFTCPQLSLRAHTILRSSKALNTLQMYGIH